tara:strand:- start:404 stop:661 length:258 start_codon:yes stop_codon:yes gene_type:complete
MSSDSVNINVTEKVDEVEAVQEPVKSQAKEENTEERFDLLKATITDDNIALNVMVGFLGLAQKRGTFAINESAKIYECIKQFQRS